MNFKKLLLFVAAPLMLVMAGCQPEPVAPSYAACEVVDAEGNALTELSFTAEAGSQTFTIKATRSWTITTTADWYGVTPNSMTNTDNTEKSTVVIVSALANDGEARSISLTITCGDLEPINITVSQADAEGNTTGGSGDGTEASPYSVARALEIINGGQYTTDMVYTAGTISSIKEVNTSYGNATFDISDDGTTTSGQLTIFRCKYLNNTKFTSADQIKVGDKVVVLGALTLYNTTPEVTQGGYLVKINDLEGTPAPELKEGPYTSDEAFVCKADNSTTATYTLNGLKIGSEDVSGFKLGKGTLEGVFTSGAVGVSGDKYLNFYAAAWKGSTVTLYWSVDGGAVQSQALTANDSISDDLAAMSFAATDHYSIKLTGLTATSKIQFGTNATFANTKYDRNAPRAVVCGVKLSDSPIEGVAGGGGSTEPETPAGEVTLDKITAAGDYKVEGATVVATYAEGAILKDATGLGWAYKKEHGLAVGDVVTVEGAVKAYNGVFEFNNPTITKTGTATVAHSTAETWTGAAVEAYITAPAFKYVTVTGTYSTSQNQDGTKTYHNLTVEGTSKQVSFNAPDKDYSSLVGKKVVATGYATGGYKDYAYITLTSLYEEGTTPTPDPEPETPAGAVTLDKITAAGDYKVVGATVVATYADGAILKDATGLGWAYKKEHGLAVGDVVTVEGAVKAYNGVFEFNNPTITKTGTATVAHSTAETWTGAAVEAYITAPAFKYVTVTGTYSTSQNQDGTKTYHNLTVEGTSKQVSFNAPDKDYSSLVGKKVVATGYATGGYKDYAYITLTSLSEDGGTTEPDPTPDPTPDPEPTPDPTPGEGDTTDGTTISQDIFANTGALDGKTITWDFDEFTVSNNQHNSSNAIRTTDTDHFRAYQGSLLTFTAKSGKKFSKIVVTCTGSSYATELVNSFGTSVATANGAEVTITCDSAEVSAEMVKQVRFKKVAVTLN